MGNGPNEVINGRGVIMPDVFIVCPKCDATMERGFILDVTDAGKRVSEWVNGAPEYGFFGGLKIEDREQHEVTAYRCVRCGYIEFYAPFPNISGP
jgi:predicted nucleic-acid-binding Zn-ribbon protein